MVALPGVLNHYVNTDRAWIGMIALSVLCHALFFSGAIFLPGLRLNTARIPSAVEVDLVSLPPAATQTQRPSRRSKASRKVKPVKKSEKTAPIKAPAPTKETVSLAAKPLKVKSSVKKKNNDVSKAIDKAIAKIEKKASESRSLSVLQAIDKLRKKDQANSAMVDASPDSSATGGIGKKTLELLDIYNAEIWNLIQKNWAYSEQIDQGPSNPEAVVIVKIMRDGEIRDMWFEKRSASKYFDETVVKALKKSNPLPPLPDGFLKPYYDVGFRFNPSELKRRP
jgi:colicin import membrane protein